MRGLSKLLEQTARSVSEGKRAEHGAQTACRKLVEQTRISREVIERIARLTSDLPSTSPRDGRNVAVLKSSSARSIAVTPVAHGDRRTRSEAIGIIRDVHESSTGLRRLAQTVSEGDKVEAIATGDATRRLAEQVDDLLRVAETNALAESSLVSE